MIAVELRKMLVSRRTWVTILLIDALPTLVAILLAVTDLGPRPGTGPAFLSAVMTDGTLFPLAALAIVLPLFLPIAVALTAGDAIAGEGQAGTLRYVLVRPVGRTRLLVAKLVAVMAFVVVTVLVVAATAYVVGIAAARPGGPDHRHDQHLRLDACRSQELVLRTLLALAYAMLCMLGVASIALFLSTVTDSPLGGGDGQPGGPDRLDPAAHARGGRPAEALPAHPATGSPSSTCSATPSCGATWCAGRCSSSCTSWSSSPPAGPTSRPRT